MAVVGDPVYAAFTRRPAAAVEEATLRTQSCRAGMAGTDKTDSLFNKSESGEPGQ
jgi:hypothetical protein